MAKPRKITADASLLSAALEGLLLQRGRLEEQIRQVRAMLGKRAPGKPAAAAEPEKAAPAKKRKRRKMSAEARKRIAEAQKKRWAAFRKAQG